MLNNSSDSIKTGVIAGFLGALGDAIIHIPAFFLIGTSTTAHYISQLMFPNKEVTIIRFVFGFSTHFFAGATVGILLYFLLKITGRDYALLKGIGMGIVFWIVHVIVIPNLVAPRPYLYRTELEAFVDLVAHLAYGAIASIYLIKAFKYSSE